MANMDALGADQLARIASAGGGFRVGAALGVDQLSRIASALRPGARMVVESAASLGSVNLARIAAAGKGAVFFE